MNRTVTVLSRNYSTGLGVIRSLGAAGYEVELIASVRKKGSSAIASASRYVTYTKEVFSQDITTDDGEELVRVLTERAEKTGKKTVLFPTDDFTASVAANAYKRLSEYYYLPHVGDDKPFGLVQLMDKTVQAHAAEKAGLNVPKQQKLELSGDIALPDDISFPCFVKPLMSIKGQKGEMARCENAAELNDRLAAMKEKDPDRSVLVQEYLDITHEYDLSGVCLDGEVIIPAIIEKTGIARHEKGVTLSGTVVSWDRLGEEAKNEVFSFVESLGYTGMFDLELNLCGDRLYFGEINLRSGGPNFAYLLSGVNLPEFFVKHMYGESCDGLSKTVREYGRSFVYEKVAWEDFIYSHISRRKLRERIFSADFTLLCCDADKKPGRVFRRRIRLSAIKHRLKMLLGLEKRCEAKGDKPPTVLVTGRNWLNNLSAVRALGKAGYAVRVLRIFKKRPKRTNLLRRMRPEAKSVYTESYNEVTADKPDALYDALAALRGGGDKPLLLPTDDYSAYCCDTDYARLSELFVLPNIDEKQGALAALMEKNEQKKLAAAMGLPVLKSTLVKSVNGAYEIPDGIKFPCFVKPNVSMKSNKAQMRRCEDGEELKKLLKNCTGDMLCEEFAEITGEYSVLGASANGAAAASCVFRTLCGGHSERKGVAVSGVTVPADELGDIPQKCAEFVRSLGYTGLYDIDLIKTADGSLYFTEINFRAGASVHAFTQSGVNLPAEIADCVLKGAALRSVSPHTAGRSFVSEKVLMEEYARGDMKAGRTRELMRSSDMLFVKDSADPAPYRYFRMFYAFAALVRALNRIRDRK